MARSGLRAEARDALIFANHLARPAVRAGGPIVRGHDLLQLVGDPQRAGPIVDPLPAAFQVRVHFALAVLGAGAGTIEYAFGEPGDGANAAGVLEPALAAGRAPLQECP